MTDASLNPKKELPMNDKNLSALMWLINQFPKTFFIRPQAIKPLKLGIHQDLRAYIQDHPIPYSMSQLRAVLWCYTHSKAYIRALTQQGAMRIDLQGESCDAVSEAARLEAINSLASKQKSRTSLA